MVTVAQAHGRVVGFAIAGAGRQVGDHQPVRDRELYSLYVLGARHGTGIGQALLETVLAPTTPAQLWVAESNPRARRFYERNGFVADGARFVDESVHLAEVRHVRCAAHQRPPHTPFRAGPAGRHAPGPGDASARKTAEATPGGGG